MCCVHESKITCRFNSTIRRAPGPCVPPSSTKSYILMYVFHLNWCHTLCTVLGHDDDSLPKIWVDKIYNETLKSMHLLLKQIKYAVRMSQSNFAYVPNNCHKVYLSWLVSELGRHILNILWLVRVTRRFRHAEYCTHNICKAFMRIINFSDSWDE